MDTEETKTPGSPVQMGLLGTGLLLVSLFLSRSYEPGGMVYLGRFLFLVALVLLVWAVIIWYRQSQEPEQERDPEV